MAECESCGEFASSSAELGLCDDCFSNVLICTSCGLYFDGESVESVETNDGQDICPSCSG